jgi:ComF family protein
MAMFNYEKSGMAQELIHALKYESRPEIGITLGQKYGQKIGLATKDNNFEAIIPVPLHEKKRLKRGYNQSEEFAKGMSQGLNIPIYDRVLLRQRNAPTQTALSREQRWNNVSKDYTLQFQESLISKHVLLVDDVLTTGATLEACGRLLLSIPGLSLSVATIAIA